MWYACCGAIQKRRRFALFLTGGSFFWCPLIYGKGGCPMVTYSDLIQIGILIVGIISLIIQANNKKK